MPTIPNPNSAEQLSPKRNQNLMACKAVQVTSSHPSSFLPSLNSSLRCIRLPHVTNYTYMRRTPLASAEKNRRQKRCVEDSPNHPSQLCE
ncbi:hypothetical protein L596_007768 [Steinernema carpocapsae]|uniref:Uncharacterized protein n=1 Tax=Steinernema carpocapsae TaxID=34508 RepID=A0A4U5PAF8_STECR|nr:hypothetical protein L596_007768 [Steinernema carpocapsae]